MRAYLGPYFKCKYKPHNQFYMQRHCILCKTNCYHNFCGGCGSRPIEEKVMTGGTGPEPGLVENVRKIDSLELLIIDGSFTTFSSFGEYAHTHVLVPKLGSFNLITATGKKGGMCYTTKSLITEMGSLLQGPSLLNEFLQEYDKQRLSLERLYLKVEDCFGCVIKNEYP